MAVLPLRRDRAGPLPLRAAEPDARSVSIAVGDDGLPEISIGAPPPEAKPSSGDDSFDRNLAEDLDDAALTALASHLLEGIEADLEGRAEWEETVDRAAAYLGVKLTDPAVTVAADGTVCQDVATCMIEAALKMWGTAYAELLPVGGPVKVERDDPVPVVGSVGGSAPGPGAAAGAGISGAPPSPAEPGQPAVTEADAAGDDLAEALERDMNWYLTKCDRGYYPDFSKMLMNRNLIGLACREVYRCPIERKPLSRWVMAQDVIVQGSPAHLGELGRRVTLRKKVAPSVMRRMMVAGEYKDVPLVHPTGITTATEIAVGETEGVSPTPSLPRDYDHTVYECATEIGSGTSHDLFGSLEMLDKDERGRKVGFPLPYRVALDVDSRTVLAIRRNWKKGDADYRPRRRLVKYGMIPAFGGGFYDWGLLHLVGNPTQAATMLLRSGVDAGLFANFPAWAMAQGAASRLENTVMRPGPGEVVRIPGTAGTKISDQMMPWPYKEPSAQSMAMQAKLEQDVKSVAGVVNLPVGEGRLGNTPVGTIMSYIESVSMVPGAVHKADHTAQAEEFELLRELLAEEPEVLWRGNKSPARRWQTTEEMMSPDLAPAADPNTPSQMHRLLKVQGLISLGGQQQFALGDKDGPIVNQRAIYRRAIEVLVGTDADEYTMPKQPPQQGAPPPDPRVVAAQIKAASEQAKSQAQSGIEGQKHQDKMQEIAVASDDKDKDRESDERRDAMKLAASHAGDAMQQQHEVGQGVADRAHEVGLAAMDHVANLTAPLVAPQGQDGGQQ